MCDVYFVSTLKFTADSAIETHLCLHEEWALSVYICQNVTLSSTDTMSEQDNCLDVSR